jgi:hypothetical protein
MLETAASFGLAGFLALDHTRIAGQETFFAESDAKRRLKFHDRTGNAQLDRA